MVVVPAKGRRCAMWGLRAALSLAPNHTTTVRRITFHPQIHCSESARRQRVGGRIFAAIRLPQHTPNVLAAQESQCESSGGSAVRLSDLRGTDGADFVAGAQGCRLPFSEERRGFRLRNKRGFLEGKIKACGTVPVFPQAKVLSAHCLLECRDFWPMVPRSRARF